MNVFSVIYNLPIGTKVILQGDYPGTVHEVYGYEWFAKDANIIFKDGGKLNISRLELITQVLG